MRLYLWQSKFYWWANERTSTPGDFVADVNSEAEYQTRRKVRWLLLIVGEFTRIFYSILFWHSHLSYHSGSKVTDTAPHLSFGVSQALAWWDSFYRFFVFRWLFGDMGIDFRVSASQYCASRDADPFSCLRSHCILFIWLGFWQKQFRIEVFRRKRLDG